MSTTSCDDCRRSTSMHCWRHPIIVGIAALPAPPAEGVPRTPSDPSGCPICGDWRDYPTADCANCGWAIRPCGDALGLCVYAGPHEGPHKIAGSWKQRIEAEAAQPAPEVSVSGEADTPGLDRDLLDQSVNVLYGMRNFILHNRECAFAKGITGIETENVPCSCGFDQVEAAYDSLIDRLLARLRGGKR